ncbi:MAG: 2-amino-4-hydroxy-6-hydroxymethyldihydropteridine diphosphokinase [Ruminococcaceae bacterium]|nr:2-amino-4-hydroxy-6-hydroxymethyldihydropteridine diphosphokinase [Oscillospiraceae bacterium]
MRKALIGIGSNIGDRKEHIDTAIEALNHIPSVKVARMSPIYETEPWGYVNQENFYNAVIEVETNLTANTLLGVCLGIEAGIGRIRNIKNGPRVLDLDLLLFEGQECMSAELTLPHPRMFERDFVLIPLRDLYPEMKIYKKYNLVHYYDMLEESKTMKKLEF